MMPTKVDDKVKTPIKRKRTTQGGKQSKRARHSIELCTTPLLANSLPVGDVGHGYAIRGAIYLTDHHFTSSLVKSNGAV
jgi:hypothetical protein